jgi:hypothetical protein
VDSPLGPGAARRSRPRCKSGNGASKERGDDVRRVLWVGIGLLLFAALVGATVASAGATLCTGPLGAVTISGDIVAGAGCDLSETTVNGNVTVTPGGSLTSGATTTISGNVKSRRATSVAISGSVGGNVLIDGTTGADGGGTAVSFGTVQGNIEIKKSSPPVRVESEIVGGNVKLRDNAGSASFAPIGEVQVLSSTIRGNLDVSKNQLTGADLNLAWVLFNTIGGNLKIHGNSATGGESSQNSVLAQSNSVGGNLEVNDNTAIGAVGSINTVRVAINTVSGNLDCRNNVPAAVGGANTAKQKKGECAAL